MFVFGLVYVLVDDAIQISYYVMGRVWVYVSLFVYRFVVEALMFVCRLVVDVPYGELWLCWYV